MKKNYSPVEQFYYDGYKAGCQGCGCLIGIILISLIAFMIYLITKSGIYNGQGLH